MPLCNAIESLIFGLLTKKAQIGLESEFSVSGNKLHGAGRPVQFIPTQKFGGRFRRNEFIIIHYTAGRSVESAVSTFKRYEVSAHLIIGRDGQVVQMVDFGQRAWHAGKSRFGKRKDLNACSIGIELVNWGYYGPHVASSVETNDWIKAPHRLERAERLWEPFPKAQLTTCEQIVRCLMSHYSIPAAHVLGHDEISLSGKVDPGPACPMSMLRGRNGDRI